MSNENKKKDNKRTYQLKARARRQEEIHKRITIAAMRLHEKVGPAKTTMNAIAELAGVQRATVYNHFPGESELFEACSSHWFMENPPPDFTKWQAIENRSQRVRKAILEMYRYYEKGQAMLQKVLRDAPVVPAMEEIRKTKWLPMLDAIIEIVIGSNDQISKSERKSLKAILNVIFDFFTWHKLVNSGLSTKLAAQLSFSWVETYLSNKS